MPAKPLRSTTARGYGSQHQRTRAYWKPKVDRGETVCARCGHPIQPGTPWDLGHDDHDRSRYQGPEHRGCNRTAGARVGAQKRWGTRRRKAMQPNTSRNW